MIKVISRLFLFIIPLLWPLGCVDSIIRKDHYGGLVRAQISSADSTSSLVDAIRTVLGISGPISTLSQDSDCRNYYANRLQKSGAAFNISLCYGDDKKSATGRSVTISILTNRGRDLDVRKEIDSLLEALKNQMQGQVDQSQVSIEQIAFYLF